MDLDVSSSKKDVNSPPVVSETSVDVDEILVRNMADEKKTNEAKDTLNVAPNNNSKEAVVKKEIVDGEGAIARNCYDTFETVNLLLLEDEELDKDYISYEKGEKLPMDAETEILSSAGNKIKHFLIRCNLEMNQKEWANESNFEKAGELSHLPFYYKGKYLKRELISKVIGKFIELNLADVFNDFFVFSLKTCSIIFEKDEEYFKSEIIALKQQNTDNSLDEEINKFIMLLYTQRILSSLMTVAIAGTDNSHKFCETCMEGGFISTIFQLLEIYLSINDDEEMKVCFLIETLFAMLWKKDLKSQKCNSE